MRKPLRQMKVGRIERKPSEQYLFESATPEDTGTEFHVIAHPAIIIPIGVLVLYEQIGVNFGHYISTKPTVPPGQKWDVGDQ